MIYDETFYFDTIVNWEGTQSVQCDRPWVVTIHFVDVLMAQLVRALAGVGGWCNPRPGRYNTTQINTQTESQPLRPLTKSLTPKLVSKSSNPPYAS